MSVLTGACVCGSVRYELTAPFEAASYCHCSRCQRRTGTGSSVNGRVAPGSFRILEGEDLIKGWDPGDGGAEKCFCSKCGSALFSRNARTKEVDGVRLGTVDGDPGIRPQFRQFTAYAAVWDPLPDDGLPHYPERKA